VGGLAGGCVGRAAFQNMGAPLPIARTDDVRSCVVILTVVSAAVIRRSVVWQTDANNQYNRIGRSDFGGANRFDK